MICPRCGKQNPDDARFCDGCGNALAGGASNGNYGAPPPPPPVQYQQNYQAPPQSYQAPGAYASGMDTSPMSVGQYIGTFLLSAIPIAGFILLLVWAFGSGTNVNKKNWARAVLILGIIGAVLSIIFGAVLFKAIMDIMESMVYY